MLRIGATETSLRPPLPCIEADEAALLEPIAARPQPAAAVGAVARRDGQVDVVNLDVGGPAAERRQDYIHARGTRQLRAVAATVLVRIPHEGVD